MSGNEGTSGTAPRQPVHEPDIDPEQVLHALGIAGARGIELISGGSDTAIWRLEIGTGRYALRLFRSDQKRAAQRETAAMVAARDQGLPVPSIARQGMWDDRPVMLISWMPGQTLREALMAHPGKVERLGVAFGREQARIHQCVAPAVLRDHDLRWVDVPGAEGDIINQVRRFCAETQTLLHLDYHPLNVLVEQGAISAILDWTNARAGDPRCDLARTETILLFAPFHLHDAGATAIVDARQALLSGWRRGYVAVTGPMHGMAPFRTWAAAFMLRDLEPRLGRPDLPWLTEEWLERVMDWGRMQGGSTGADAF